MPEHMKRREAVYYFRRVVPKDLQAAGHPREICRSLNTREFTEAKRRLHIESVRFDEWVLAQRTKLAEARQMASANVSLPSSIADEMEEYARESAAYFAELYAGEDENGLSYDEQLALQRPRERKEDAEYFAELERSRTVPLPQLYADYARSSQLAAATVKQWRAVVDHLIGFLGHDDALRLRASDLRKWRDQLAVEVGPRGKLVKPRRSMTAS